MVIFFPPDLLPPRTLYPLLALEPLNPLHPEPMVSFWGILFVVMAVRWKVNMRTDSSTERYL